MSHFFRLFSLASVSIMLGGTGFAANAAALQLSAPLDYQVTQCNDVNKGSITIAGEAAATEIEVRRSPIPLHRVSRAKAA